VILAPGSIWKVFKVVQAIFEKFGAGPVSWGGLTAPQAVRSQRGGLTAQGMWSNCPGQCEQDFALCCIPMLHHCIDSGGCALAQGELAYVQGELSVLFELWIGGLCSLLEHGFVSDVSSRCPCLRGPRLVFPQVMLLFASPLAFNHLLEFLLLVSFLFFFSLVTKSCVLSMHSSRGRLRTMCSSRTSGWSLPGVMSD
jgi:hypothetical protein